MRLLGKQIHIHLTYTSWEKLAQCPRMPIGLQEPIKDIMQCFPDVQAIREAGAALTNATRYLNKDFTVGRAGVLTQVGDDHALDIPPADYSFELDLSSGDNQRKLLRFLVALEAVEIAKAKQPKPKRILIDGREVGEHLAAFSLEVMSTKNPSCKGIITCVKLKPKPVFRIQLS